LAHALSSEGGYVRARERVLRERDRRGDGKVMSCALIDESSAGGPRAFGVPVSSDGMIVIDPAGPVIGS